MDTFFRVKLSVRMGSRVRMVGRGLAGVMARQQGRCVQRIHARSVLMDFFVSL